MNKKKALATIKKMNNENINVFNKYKQEFGFTVYANALMYLQHYTELTYTNSPEDSIIFLHKLSKQGYGEIWINNLKQDYATC